MRSGGCFRRCFDLACPGAAPAKGNSNSIRGFKNTIRYKYFGKTGEQVSVLGYGNMRPPMVNGDYSRIDESGAMRLVLYAFDQGVNYLDTGWPYHGGVFKNGDFNEGGASELFVGRVLKEVGRDKVYVADKMPTWLINRPEDFDAFLDRQLQRLGTDHIDFYLLHNPVRPLWQRITGLGVVKFLEKAKKEGKIRYAGFSFHDTPELFTEKTNYYDFDFCQHAINYYDVNFQAGLSSIRRAARRGMGIVAMEPLMAGLLARHLPAPAKKVFQDSGRNWSPAEWALRWVWNQPEVSLLVSGMHTLEQVEENVRLASLPDASLSVEDFLVLARALDALHEKDIIPCTQCGLCSCPFGVAIKDNFTIINADRNFAVTALSDKNYDFMLRGTGMEASLCNNCGQCGFMCPLGIDIPNWLHVVARYFDEHHIKDGWH